MSKYNSTLKYVASTPRSQRKGKGARYYGSTIPSLPSAGGVSLSYVEANFVTLDTIQAISGIKDFTNGLKVGGLSAYKSQDDVVYLDANLVVRGGVTAWGTNEQTAPNIFEGLPIDGTSIYWDNGVLKSSATSSGGINEEQLADYLTTNGYATQSWVTGKGYLTGITGTMVTTALGYTPYNSANFTKANIKSTLGISDWALASAKPTYTASEVGALATSGGSLSGQLIVSYSGSSIIVHRTQALAPVIGFTNPEGVLGNIGVSNVNKKPIFIETSGNIKTLAFTSDIPTSLKNPNALSWSGYSSGSYDGSTAQNIALPTKLSQLTDDVVSGKYFPITGGTVNGDISLPNGNRLISPSGNIAGTRIFGDDTTNYRTILGTAIINTLLIGNSTLKFWKGAVNKEYEIIDTSMPSISFPKYIATGIGSTEQSGYKVKGNGVDVTFGANDATGGAYLWVASYHALRLATNGAERIRIDAEGHVGIGTTAPSEKLHVYGNILATGGVTAQNSSDRRLKENIRTFSATKVLKSLGGVFEYEYVASEVEKNHIYAGTHFGLIYQNIKGTALDVMCHKREDGMGALNYLHPKFISLIAGATMENTTEIENLKRENRELKERVKQLENRAA